MGDKLRKILADWQKEREQAAAWLAELTNEQLDRESAPVTMAKIGQFTDYTLPEMTVRQLMNRITDHHRDHHHRDHHHRDHRHRDHRRRDHHHQICDQESPVFRAWLQLQLILWLPTPPTPS